MAGEWAPRMMAPSEAPATAQVWLDAWRDGHLGNVPEALIKYRTLESFANRLAKMGDALRVAGPEGAPLGFCAIKEDELYQLFVSADARGTGLAKTLLADGERRIAAGGATVAFLDCAPGNDRAAAFYRKCGWTFREETTWDVETAEGPFAMPAWIFEKQVG
ncbi:MAG: GNAT family N-acetyltransferase [Pseudomonadota bacterium]